MARPPRPGFNRVTQARVHAVIRPLFRVLPCIYITRIYTSSRYNPTDASDQLDRPSMDYVKSLATNLINRRGTERPTSQGSSYAAYQPHFPPSPFTPPTGGSSKEQQAFYVAPTYPPPSSASPSVPVTVQRPWVRFHPLSSFAPIRQKCMLIAVYTYIHILIIAHRHLSPFEPASFYPSSSS